MKNTIDRIVRDITAVCENEDVFAGDRDGARLPNRGAIIGIIKDLRRVIFPGYFGDELSYGVSPEYFFASMLANVSHELSLQIATALIYKSPDADQEEIRRQAEMYSKAFISRIPKIQQMLLMDVQAGFDGDPAAGSREDIIFSYPGMFAIYVYRMAHELYQMGIPFIPRIMTEYAHGKTGIDINPGAVIGRYFFIDHGTGIVIGETTTIGDYVKLYQGVTLGALSTRKGQQLSGVKRHPTIGNYVTIYANATILGGDTVIGEDTVIGGNTFITESVPAHSRVSLKEPELLVTTSGPKKTDGLWDYVI